MIAEPTTPDAGPDPASAGEAAEFTPDWLGLREPADAVARSVALLGPVRHHLAGRDRTVIHDLGCGTGSMGRWLAARLPGPQHWVLYDRDPVLLAHARANMPAAADGTAVTVETRQRDVAELTAADLVGADLVTASALLDLLAREEVAALARACADAGCPALLTLSVVGRVDLDPADPLDADLAAAFDAHQRRRHGGRQLLGPDAVDATVEAFIRSGATVRVRPSPWLLGPDQAALTTEWLRGWVAAATDQRPELAAPAADYLPRRLAAAAAGGLRVAVHHSDLLAQPQ
jgi:hypothetical protein